jgi:hypothetical protein
MKIMLGTLLAIVAAPLLAQTAPPPAPATMQARPGTPITPMPPGVRALNNQTGEQAQLDVAQCQNSASQATGYVPTATPAPPPQGTPPVGGRAKGAAVGAGAGAIMGDTGTGAAAGAVAGGMNQRQDRRKAQAQQQQMAAAKAQKAAAWQTSYSGCLQGRGYALEAPLVTTPAT